jgi:23S rRNA U2552 (ribose-2'-O)-methylase RlmE/FtsJ
MSLAELFQNPHGRNWEPSHSSSSQKYEGNMTGGSSNHSHRQRSNSFGGYIPPERRQQNNFQKYGGQSWGNNRRSKYQNDNNQKRSRSQSPYVPRYGRQQHGGNTSFREQQRLSKGEGYRGKQLFSAKDIQTMRAETEEEPLAPIVYLIPKTAGHEKGKEGTTLKLLDQTPEIKLGLGHPIPLYRFGFQQWVYQTKDGFGDLLKQSNYTKTYHILNRIENKIPDHKEQSLDYSAYQYFGFDKKPTILNRAFYKMWELCMLFNLVPTTGKFRSVHLAEAPGSFIEAVIQFRDKFAKSSKGDRQYGISIHSERGDVPEMQTKFMEYYKNRIVVHPTVSAEKSGRNGMDNGDLTNPLTIANLTRENPGDAQLVTADGGIPWKDENLQEPESFQLIFGEILCALHVQESGGHFVLKLYDTFCVFTWKLILLINECYEHVHMVKPLTSRDSNSERYLVCTNFKLSDDKRKRLCKKLLEQLADWRDKNATFSKGSGGYLQAQDIYPDVAIPEWLEPTIRAMNTHIVNRQLTCINKMCLYLKENDRYGATYQQSLTKQLANSAVWIANFFRKEPHAIQEYFREVQRKLGESRALLFTERYV